MANNDLKTIKELLEVVKNKVGGTEVRVRKLSHEIRGLKDQQSVMNKKLDNLQAGMDELHKKADVIFKFASKVDEDLQGVKRRLGRIERVPVIASEI